MNTNQCLSFRKYTNQIQKMLCQESGMVEAACLYMGGVIMVLFHYVWISWINKTQYGPKVDHS